MVKPSDLGSAVLMGPDRLLRRGCISEQRADLGISGTAMKAPILQVTL